MMKSQAARYMKVPPANDYMITMVKPPDDYTLAPIIIPIGLDRMKITKKLRVNQ